VLPDNAPPGTLEDILLECAASSYPTLLGGARRFVEGIDIDSAEFEPRDRQDFKAPAGKNKAITACVANVLRPGKAVQASIQDNRWLEGPALELERVRAVRKFLGKLLDLDGSAPGPPPA
jgi:hypothetical protein